MAAITKEKLPLIKQWYYGNRMSAHDIAQKLSVSLDAVYYFMRHHNLSRKTAAEANKDAFTRKPPSFEVRRRLTSAGEKLKTAGTVLYWAEGYKTEKASGLDFANSDPAMIALFLKALRTMFKLDENKFRAHLYCYTNQNMQQLIVFWSKLTHIPETRFSKPYVRKDSNPKNERKMRYGLLHIRYSDKKLLEEVLKLIEEQKKLAQVVP